MGATFDRPLPHPVLLCGDSVEAAIKETTHVELTFMRPEDKQAALVQLIRVETQLAALRMRLMAVSDDLALEQGARDVAALVTHHTRTDEGANRRDLALAESLDRRWHRVAEALTIGDVNVAQARVITHALDELPTDTIPAAVIARAEEHLVAEAECRAEGCSIPAAWCEAHHPGRPWSQGGRTDLREGVLLCPWHHHRAHDSSFDAHRLAKGDVRFSRRT